MNFSHWWLILLNVLIFAGIVAGNQNNRVNILNKRIDELVSKMTIEEKVGQMTQLSVEFVSKGYPDTQDPLELDMNKLRSVILEFNIGSLLNVGTHAHSVEQWHEIIRTIQDIAFKESRLGIPIIYGIDAVHGAGYVKDATLFPQSIGMAATWNRELMKKNGEVTAYEVRVTGIPWNFNPVLGIGRQPLWSRLWETFGEDPYLASAMGVAYINGLEGDGNDISHPEKVASCIKHYLGYSFPLSGKDRTPAWIPERMLREYFLPPFQSAIDAGAHTLMVNSSEINGVPIHSSYYYLTELLRNELGFTGFVVSDWNDIRNLHDRERVASSQKEAVRLAVMAGVDMSMVPLDLSFYHLLIQLVKEGSIQESRIDEAVRRILRVKFELGLFDNPYPNIRLKERFACAEFQALNIQAARESITLLKNRNKLLPLNKNTRVLVTGPTADKLSYLNGGWTITWQGDREELYPREKFTILQAIEQTIGKEYVTYVPGTEVTNEIDIQAAVKASIGKDVAIVCLGESTYCESPGNITDITLPEPQLLLTQALARTGISVVIILVEGRPRIIKRIEGMAESIIMAYLPGLEGGRAISDVLFGDFNPCGKLPFTYPRNPNDLTLYDHKHSEHNGEHTYYNPQFPFGYGLSYTTFTYSDLQLEKQRITKGESLNVTVTVTNSGNRSGKEVIQLYLSDLYATVTPSVKKLKGFQKVELKPGESKTVNFTLTPKDLSFIGLENKPVIESGEFTVTISNLKANFFVQ